MTWPVSQPCRRSSFAMQATRSTALLLLSPGDNVVYMEDVYGGTYRLFDKVLKRFGLNFSAVDASDLDAVERARWRTAAARWSAWTTPSRLRIFSSR